MSGIYVREPTETSKAPELYVTPAVTEQQYQQVRHAVQHSASCTSSNIAFFVEGLCMLASFSGLCAHWVYSEGPSQASHQSMFVGCVFAFHWGADRV